MSEVRELPAASQQDATSGSRISSNRHRVVETVCMVMGPIALGLYLEVAGPALPDLMCQAGADYEQIGRVLSARSAGYLLGSLASGVLVERLPAHTEAYLGAAYLTGALGTALIPWSPRLWLLGIMFHLQGLAEGFIDTCNNSFMILLWGKKSAAPVHALHFGFGVGAVLAPQLSRPFVMPKVSASGNSTIPSSQHFIRTGSGAIRICPEEQHIYIPYSIIAAFTLLFFFIFLMFYLLTRKHRTTTIPASEENPRHRTASHVWAMTKKTFNPGSCTNGKVLFGSLFFLLIFVFYMNTVGAERAYGKFIYSYALESGLFSVDDATLLNTVFWISFTSARGLAILAALVVAPRILLFVEISCMLAASLVLIDYGFDTPVVLWVLSGVMGFALSPVFPSGLAWANLYVTMSGVAVALVFTGAAAGGFFYQWFTGYMFEYHGPRTLMHVMTGDSAALLATFILLQLLVVRYFGFRGNRFDNDPIPGSSARLLHGRAAYEELQMADKSQHDTD